MPLFSGLLIPGAYEQEHATQLYPCLDRFDLRSNLFWMRLLWECHNQSQDTNWRHCLTGPELTFFHKRKGVLKIDQSVKMPWLRLSMGVTSSRSSAPAYTYCLFGCHNDHPALLWNRRKFDQFAGKQKHINKLICLCNLIMWHQTSEKKNFDTKVTII